MLDPLISAPRAGPPSDRATPMERPAERHDQTDSGTGGAPNGQAFGGASFQQMYDTDGATPKADPASELPIDPDPAAPDSAAPQGTADTPKGSNADVTRSLPTTPLAQQAPLPEGRRAATPTPSRVTDGSEKLRNRDDEHIPLDIPGTMPRLGTDPTPLHNPAVPQQAMQPLSAPITPSVQTQLSAQNGVDHDTDVPGTSAQSPRFASILETGPADRAQAWIAPAADRNPATVAQAPQGAQFETAASIRPGISDNLTEDLPAMSQGAQASARVGNAPATTLQPMESSPQNLVLGDLISASLAPATPKPAAESSLPSLIAAGAGLVAADVTRAPLGALPDHPGTTLTAQAPSPKMPSFRPSETHAGNVPPLGPSPSTGMSTGINTATGTGWQPALSGSEPVQPSPTTAPVALSSQVPVGTQISAQTPVQTTAQTTAQTPVQIPVHISVHNPQQDRPNTGVQALTRMDHTSVQNSGIAGEMTGARPPIAPISGDPLRAQPPEPNLASGQPRSTIPAVTPASTLPDTAAPNPGRDAPATTRVEAIVSRVTPVQTHPIVPTGAPQRPNAETSTRPRAMLDMPIQGTTQTVITTVPERPAQQSSMTAPVHPTPAVHPTLPLLQPATATVAQGDQRADRAEAKLPEPAQSVRHPDLATAPMSATAPALPRGIAEGYRPDRSTPEPSPPTQTQSASNQSAPPQPVPAHSAPPAFAPTPDFRSTLVEREREWPPIGASGRFGDIPTTSDLRAGTDSRGTSLLGPPPGSPRAADIARQISTQIATPMRAGGEQMIEMTLNPAELGRLQMNLTPGDGTMSVSITAERPETLDLIRRHIDQLMREFRDMGYGGTEFSFADQSPQKEPTNGRPGGPAGGDTTADMAGTHGPGDMAARRAIASDGLDLRL